MKKFLLILLALCSQASYSQKIGDKIFDKFDSTYTISTKDETLVGKILGKNFLYVIIYYACLKQAKFINRPDAKTFNVQFGFKTNIVTSIDNESEIKVEFSDGTLGTYNLRNFNNRIVTEMGVISFKVPLGDKLYTTDIKSIRIRTSETNLDYEIPTKKASYIKNALTLVKTESEKQ